MTKENEILVSYDANDDPKRPYRAAPSSELEVGHAAARVHQPYWRCGSGVELKLPAFGIETPRYPLICIKLTAAFSSSF